MSKEPDPAAASTDEKAATTLPGVVQKIIKSPDPTIPEKAQIGVEGADDLYREIRIDNTLTDKNGTEVGLKPGAQVEVTIEAEPQGTVKKKPASSTARPTTG